MCNLEIQINKKRKWHALFNNLSSSLLADRRLFVTDDELDFHCIIV